MRTLTLLAAMPLAFAADWPQWRGPARDGTVQDWQPPASWPEKLQSRWRVEAGEGHSSPVIVGTRVYTHTRQGDQELVSAWELKDGRRVWQQSIATPYDMNPAATAHGKGPKSTPVAAGGRLFTFGISGTLTAWDLATGKRIWQRDFRKEFPSTSPAFGTAMSPVVEAGMLIAHAGGDGNGALTAFDAATGATRWQWKGDGPAYSSPVIAAFDGVRQVITHSQKQLVAVSLDKGELLWNLPFTTPYEQNSVTPIVYGKLLIYSGLSNPVMAIEPRKVNGTWQARKVWEAAGVSLYMNSFVRAGNLLFGFSHRNRGQFAIVNADTGAVLWTGEPRQGENAAMLNAGEYVLALLNDATLLVFRASPKELAVVRRYTVADSPTWAHPVPVPGGILVKDKNHLALLGF